MIRSVLVFHALTLYSSHAVGHWSVDCSFPPGSYSANQTPSATPVRSGVMPSSAIPSVNQLHAHVTSEYVDIVSQTLPGLPPLGSDVALLLAQDAEYYIRHLIHLAKKRMKHSKRTSLSVHDIHLSENPKDRQPSLGLYSSKTPSFQSITPGLYVLKDSTVSLFDLIRQPLPPSACPPTLQRSGIISPSTSFSTKLSSSYATNPLVIAIDTYLTAPQRISPTLIERTLSSIGASKTIIPFYSIVALLRYAVNFNATSKGDITILNAALRVVKALLSRSTFGIELFEDSIISIILTCLLGPKLGSTKDINDIFEVRQHAAEALDIFLMHVADGFTKQKICNTLSWKLLDSNSTLHVVFGAVIGLSTMGRDIFEHIFVPLLPKLTASLDKLYQLASSLDPIIADETIFQITILSQAVERCMYTCNLFIEPDFITRFI